MGMFDDVRYECTCLNCHKKVENFQSKSGECVLDILDPTEVENFYSPCKSCGAWLDFSRINDNRYELSVKVKGDAIPKYRKIVTFKEDIEIVGDMITKAKAFNLLDEVVLHFYQHSKAIHDIDACASAALADWDI